MTARRYRGSSRPSLEELAAVEPLVRTVYDRLYSPRRWDGKPSEWRHNVVAFVIDSARTGASRCIVHTQPDGTEHSLEPAAVLAVLAPLTEGAPA